MRASAANVLTAVRLAAAPLLVVLAVGGRRGAFLALLAVLFASDWLDGKVARLTGSTSEAGSRLDSAADAVMFASALLAAVWLVPEVLAANVALLAATAASWVVAAVASVVRFRRLASYHTLSAKVAWWTVVSGALAVFAGWPAWLLRAGLVVTIVANLESTAITALLDDSRADVRSAWAAWRNRRRAPSHEPVRREEGP